MGVLRGWDGCRGVWNGVGVLRGCAKYVGCGVSVKGGGCVPHNVGEIGMGCGC